MSSLWLVAQREIVTRGRTKAFVISLLVSALLVAALTFLPQFFAGPDSYTVGVTGSQSLQSALTQTAKDVEITVRQFPDEAAASKAVLDGDVDAALVADRRVLADGEVDRELGLLLENAHQAAQVQRQLADAGLDPAKVAQAMRVTPWNRSRSGRTPAIRACESPSPHFWSWCCSSCSSTPPSTSPWEWSRRRGAASSRSC